MDRNTQSDQQRRQDVAGNMQAREKTQEMQKQQEKVQERRGGIGNRHFEFEAQKERIEQILQSPRSKEYRAAVSMVDFLSSNDEAIIQRLQEDMGEEFVEELQEMTDEEIFEMITQAFHEEFQELETTLDDQLIAVISKCYITGCDCHAIDKSGHILDHYETNKVLSEDLERGRMVYRQFAGNDLQCVEIYNTCCRVISNSGSVETIKNNSL